MREENEREKMERDLQINNNNWSSTEKEENTITIDEKIKRDQVNYKKKKIHIFKIPEIS